MLPSNAPSGRKAIEALLLEQLPALGPPPRGPEGLARAQRFFARLGEPQHAARQIHVVGTAGKGTAAAAIVGQLVDAGMTVGAHLSPHVYDLRERFLLDGQLPSWELVDTTMAEMWPAMLDTEVAEGRPPSFFEVTTAMAWVLGRRAGVDIFVTEAGIGGEFDATNTIARTDKITVVMPIGFDHLEILGNDLGEIARSKAAVIAAGSDVVVAPQPFVAAMDVVEAVAGERQARLHPVAPRPDAPVPWLAEASDIAAAVATLVHTPLAVRHRVTRAAVHLPGRLERTETAQRFLILDGAHNPLKLRALRLGLSSEPVRLLIAALSHEKDLDACAAELATLSGTIITTDFTVAAGDRVVRRSWSAHQLAEAIHPHRPSATVVAIPGIDAAMSEAVRCTDKGELLLATGSFMMLEPVRAAARSLGRPVAS